MPDIFYVLSDAKMNVWLVRYQIMQDALTYRREKIANHRKTYSNLIFYIKNRGRFHCADTMIIHIVTLIPLSKKQMTSSSKEAHMKIWNIEKKNMNTIYHNHNGIQGRSVHVSHIQREQLLERMELG